MATKTTPAAPVNAPAAGSGAQILQNVQTLNNTVNELKVTLASLTKLVESGFVNTGTALTSLDHRLSGLDVSFKAYNANTKRQPKTAAPSDEAAVPAANPASTSPAGEKFASNSQVWLGATYKTDAAGVKAKYFSESQLTTFAEQLAANADYQKLDADIAAASTATAKDKLRAAKVTIESKTLHQIAKADPALVKKLQDDWRAAKSEFEQQNRTPASKDA
jgi:hypothetical protein